MPRYYDCLMFFQGRGSGWSEKYCMDADLVLPPPGGGNPNNADNLEAVENVFLLLCQKRRLLLAKPFDFLAVRVNRTLTPNQSRLSYVNIPGNQSHDADDPHTSLVVTCQNDLNDARKQIHMRGIWDDINVRGGVFDPAPPGWTTNWDQFAAALILGPYGWYGKDISTRVNLLGYTQTVDGQVAFELDAALFPNGLQGLNTEVRLAGVNVRSELNGQLLVRVDSTLTCTSVKQISVFPWLFGGTMRWNTKKFIKFATVRPMKIGRRGAGAPLFSLPGRQRATVRN